MLVIKQIHIDDIKLSDFQEYPIWGWVDEDGDSPYVMPMSLTYIEDCAEIGDSDDCLNTVLFIHSEFILSYGTQYEGYIGIILGREKPFVLALNIRNAWVKFSFSPIVQKVHPAAKFFAAVGKPKEEISPITFKTKIDYVGGEPLSGEIKIE